MINRLKSDLGTDERVADEVYKDEPTGLTAGSPLRRRILTQSLIDRYHQRNIITDRQYNTAQYLFRIYNKGMKATAMKYDVRVDGGGASNDDSSVGFSDYMKAMRSLDSNMFKVVQWIVIDGMTAASLDQVDYGGRRMSMKLLRAALNQLADHFGIH
tara:strand:- start:286 stop:756 length:471 start_codon:yes stop_codon:yes gene_type:complete